MRHTVFPGNLEGSEHDYDGFFPNRTPTQKDKLYSLLLMFVTTAIWTLDSYNFARLAWLILVEQRKTPQLMRIQKLD